MQSASHHWRVAALLVQRHGGVLLRFLIVWCAVFFLMMNLAHAQNATVKGTAVLTKADGYARLVVTLDEQVDVEVRIAGQILIVQFKKPVDVAVAKLPDSAPDYVTTARRDPDGTAIRFALNQKVTPNTMAAGEKLFVDLLPPSWKGMPPGLPQEVVNELAERARAAERELQNRRVLNATKGKAQVRVRASVQPTFVRLSFDVASDVSVTSDLRGEKLKLQFSAPINFDLADARVAAPTDVTGMTQASDDGTSTVEIAFKKGLDVRSFREDKSFVVDLGAPGAAAIPDLVKPAAVALAASPPPSEPSKPRVEADNPPVVIAKPEPVAVLPAPVAPIAAPVASAPPVIGMPDAIAVEAVRTSEYLRLTFPFREKTPAAMFRRADTLWLVFDTAAPLALDELGRLAASPLAESSVLPLTHGQAVRLRLSRPQLASIVGEANHWTVTITDTMPTTPQPLSLTRSGRAAVIAFDRPGHLHKLRDPDSGEALVVVTGAEPARGFVRRQDLVDFRILESGHGVVVEPNSDDLVVGTSAEGITINRPGGLTLSAISASHQAGTQTLGPFDANSWELNKNEPFVDRRQALLHAVAGASDEKLEAARFELARFYLARGFNAEAKAVLDVAIADFREGAEDPAILVTHAVASIFAGRVSEGLKSLDHKVVASAFDSDLWRGFAYAAQERWLDAREKFKNTENIVSRLPIDLQREILISAVRAHLGSRDFGGATNKLQELRIIGTPPEMAPQLAVLRGRLDEALGRDDEAIRDYAEAIHSQDRQASAEGTLRTAALEQRTGRISNDELLNTLETLAVSWRGDAIEIETLAMLTKLYVEQNRYREAFGAARAATRLQPNAELTRRMQDEASALFADLFLGPRGGELPPVDALGVFYEYRELTPIGRRGDEMIRRLADRLVSVDLLDQASELLQYQVDHRLEGAARAQVAARLAMIYMMNRKPDRAIAALRGSRIGDLAGELRLQRLLLEGRAQSDIGRTDLALDIVASIGGREAIRLRSDIYWKAKRWREAAEQIEVLYGNRWRTFEPLSALEKADILRAAIGYALAEDALGIARLREKYAAKFDTDSDRATFDLAARPAGGNAAELGRLAKLAAAVDTLDAFLRDIRARFTDASRPAAHQGIKTDPSTTGALPAVPTMKAIP